MKLDTKLEAKLSKKKLSEGFGILLLPIGPSNNSQNLQIEKLKTMNLMEKKDR